MKFAIRFFAGMLSLLMLFSLGACQRPGSPANPQGQTTAPGTIDISPAVPDDGMKSVITVKLVYIGSRYFLAQDPQDATLLWRISGISAAKFQVGNSVTVTLASAEEAAPCPKDLPIQNNNRYTRIKDAVAKYITAALDVEDILPPLDFEPF